MAHLHVVPDGRTWKVVTEKGSVVSQHHHKKNRAIDEMNNVARSGDLKYIHGRDGQIQREQTHR